MTLGTIFKNVLGPSRSPQYYGYPTGSHKLLAEKNSGGSDYYYYTHHSKSKGKSKSDKKNAILSALAVLAFLFFLNILQNCIREQTMTRGTTMMIARVDPSSPQQGKDPNMEQTDNIRIPRKKNSSGDEKTGWKSRTLMGLEEVQETTAKPKRQVKFIRHFSGVNNWTKELTQVSDKDLEDQKLKMLNFPLYWKNNRFSVTEIPQTTVLPTMKLKKVVDIPVLEGNTVPPVVRRIKKRERTTTEASQNLNRTTVATPSPTKMIWLYKTPPPRKSLQEKYGKENKHLSYQNTTQQNSTWQGYTKSPVEKLNVQVRREVTTGGTTQVAKNTPTTQTLPVSYAATTPRNRRSDYVTTVHPVEYDEYDRYGETRDEVQLPPTPVVGLDLNTYQTFPVYNYYNHRHNSNPYKENQTVEVTPEPSNKPEVEIDRIHNEVRVPTEQPFFQQNVRTTSTYLKHPYYEKLKYRNRYQNGYYQSKNHHPVETRYRYSPHRKNSAYEPSHDHHHHSDYYPVILAKYPQEDEPGFDLVKFVWHMLTSFAKPLTKLVPTFAKENNDEPQCYDLLVCEAQRVSRFMGPTAEALASTVGTLLTWAATEETRQIVVDAINSGKDNTCQQQIKDCEDRSGGKSAMTVIAQVMEMKLR